MQRLTNIANGTRFYHPGTGLKMEKIWQSGGMCEARTACGRSVWLINDSRVLPILTLGAQL